MNCYYRLHKASRFVELLMHFKQIVQISFQVWPYWPGIYLEDLVQDGNGWDENVAKFHSNVAFPDFFAPQTYEWWDEEIRVFTKEFFKNGTGLSYDGIWIDMNEPASFTAGRPGPDGGTQVRLLVDIFIQVLSLSMDVLTTISIVRHTSRRLCERDEIQKLSASSKSKVHSSFFI